MEEAITFKPNADVAVQRLTSLYARAAQDGIFASFEIPSAALEKFKHNYPDPFCEYPDPHERIRFWDEYLHERGGLEDDSIPSAYLSEFDQGLYGGWWACAGSFHGHPENGWISSMVPPLLRDWTELDSLAFDTSARWWEIYRRQLQIFREGAAGRFGISHFILINGLNFAFELVGAAETYVSLSENPEAIRKALNLAFRVNVAVQTAFFESTTSYRGGTFSNMVQWIPGRIVSESVDPFHMTSTRCFEEWGRDPVQRIFDHFDGGVLHLHANGRHLLEAVTSLRGQSRPPGRRQGLCTGDRSAARDAPARRRPAAAALRGLSCLHRETQKTRTPGRCLLQGNALSGCRSGQSPDGTRAKLPSVAD